MLTTSCDRPSTTQHTQFSSSLFFVVRIHEQCIKKEKNINIDIHYYYFFLKKKYNDIEIKVLFTINVNLRAQSHSPHKTAITFLLKRNKKLYYMIEIIL